MQLIVPLSVYISKDFAFTRKVIEEAQGYPAKANNGRIRNKKENRPQFLALPISVM
jgi:hypothetical protein